MASYKSINMLNIDYNVNKCITYLIKNKRVLISEWRLEIMRNLVILHTEKNNCQSLKNYF